MHSLSDPGSIHLISVSHMSCLSWPCHGGVLTFAALLGEVLGHAPNGRLNEYIHILFGSGLAGVISSQWPHISYYACVPSPVMANC